MTACPIAMKDYGRIKLNRIPLNAKELLSELQYPPAMR